GAAPRTARSASAASRATGAAGARPGRSRRSTRPARRGRYDPAALAAATFESLNPATGELIDTFPRSGVEEVERAVATARAAWEDWRLVPAPERGSILFRFAQLLERSKPELSDLMTREMGKVKAEAGGDVQEAIDMSYYMGGEGR